MSDMVVTRFAPSPTGYLHIGGARTALFNWLFARAAGGKMLLRIEDTDRKRSTEDAVDKIYEGLSWLGLQWDGDAISQYARVERHQEVAMQLLASGNAYKCYASPDELAAMREKAKAEGRTATYDGTWRDRDEADAPADVAPVIRLKTPLEGETIVDDKVQGQVSWKNAALDDFVILRSDGTPTYMLAVVVDDHDMGITHIIRGDDHLTNAARQTLLFNAMDWTVPVMAHIPLIHGADGAKLSKRHGALGVETYRDMGYLPEALRNYLVRLGWSHGDDEIMTEAQMLEWFSLEGIGRSAARFDFAKLENLNGHYIRNAEDERLVDAIEDLIPHLPDGSELPKSLKPEEKTLLLRAMPGLKERAKTLTDLIDSTRYLTDKRPLNLEAKAEKILENGGREVLGKIVPHLEKVDPWEPATIEAAIREFGDQENLKLGNIAQPLRSALTGRTVSPGIFDVLAVLGKNESLARIKDHAN